MSAVSNNQNNENELTASIEAKRLADEIIAAKASGKVDALDSKSKLENLDAVEMEQLIGILHETFDMGGTLAVNSTDSAGIQKLKNTFKELLETVKKRPDIYLPSLCVDGKISSDLTAKFCAGQAGINGGIFKSPSTATTSCSTDAPATTSTTTTTDTEATTDTSTHNYSSYLAMAKAVADVTYDMSLIQSKVTEDSSLQTKWLAEENEAIIKSAQTALDDVNKQVAEYESEKRHAEHLRRTQGTLTHIFVAISIVFTAVFCPELLPLVVAVAVDQEVAVNTGGDGFIAMLTTQVANILSSSGIMSKQAAKIVADVLVILLVCSICPNVGMALMAGSMMAQSTGLFGDIADAQIAAQGLDPDSPEASNIKEGWMIAGVIVCSVVAIFGGSIMKQSSSMTDLLAKASVKLADMGMEVAANALAYAAGLLAYITNAATNATLSILRITAEEARDMLLIEKAMLIAMSLGLASQVSLDVTQSVLSKELSDTYINQADTLYEINQYSADLKIKEKTSDQLEAIAKDQANNAQKEVSSLAESLNSYLSHVDQAALGSVIQV